jgi:hypothetical protein
MDTDTITRPDETRLFAVLDRIRENPYALDMRYFYRTGIEDVCGTTKCFAGHAIDLFGKHFRWNPDVLQEDGSKASWSVIFTNPDDIPEGVRGTRLPDGTYEVAAAPYAAALLGITDEQAEGLFYYLVDDVDMLAARVRALLRGDFDEGV